MASLPDFKLLADNHLDYWTYKTPESISKLLGGTVGAGDIHNTCTIRLCHAMNLAGRTIPAKWGIITNRKSQAGKNYIIRVKNFREWMLQTFGKPVIEIRKKGGEKADRSRFEGWLGVIGMEIGFGDATGHFDLWHEDEFSAESASGAGYLDRATNIQLWADTRVTQAPV